MSDFRSLDIAFFTLLRCTLGEFRFDAFASTPWRYWGPMILTLLSFLNVFVLLTVRLALCAFRIASVSIRSRSGP